MNPYTDLGRPPLREAALRRAIVVPGGLWTELRVVAETGSTNADLAELARAGAAEGAVLVAERQTAGRGRLGRVWQSPPRAGIAVSVLLRPEGVPAVRFGWLPLLAGIALAETVRRVSEVDAYLKWPNDLLIAGAWGGPVATKSHRAGPGVDRKCAGILAESVSGAVVLGIGLNTSLREDELPRPDATSLMLAGAASADRDPLLRHLLRALSVWYGRWREAGGDPDASGVREAYRHHCGTLGRRVRVELPGGDIVEGVAADIDGDGRLLVTTEAGPRAVAAGDVAHVR